MAGRYGVSYEQRLCEKFLIVPDGCWQWTAAKRPDGYGKFRVRTGLMISAHRAVYELFKGPIPDGLHLDHLCRNPSCVNPAHVEPVAPRTNLLRGTGWSARNARKTHCKRGHPLSGEHLSINKRGHRECRTCARSRALARYYANRSVGVVEVEEEQA